MKGKEITKMARKLLALVFVFSLLQSHLVILSEFAGTAYAAIGSSIDENSAVSSTLVNESEFENILDEEKFTKERVENFVENEIEYEQTVENEVKNETKNEVGDETADDVDQSDDIVVENTTIGSDDNATGNDSVDEDVAEIINSSLHIIDAYRSLNGIVVKTNIKANAENLKDAVKESKINLAIPVAEGYIINQVLLEHGDDSKEDEPAITTSQVDNNFFVSILNDTTSENFECDYTVVFVFEGAGEVTELSLELEVVLTYEDETTLDSYSALSQEVNLAYENLNKYNITSQNTSIYKGYLYANAVSTMGYETKYSSVYNLEINSLKNIEYVLVSEDVDILKTKDGEEISLLGLNEYKSTVVDKESFDSMFEIDGYIEIYSDGLVIGKIDGMSKVVDGKYVFEYETKVSNVDFKLNKIKNVGALEILNTKVIRKLAAFDRAQIKNFSNIETKIVVKEMAKVGETELELALTEKKVNIVLEDTESKMDLQMNVNSLSAGVDNEVTFVVTLLTNEEKYELFKNPEILIELPSDVKEVEIVSINLLYKNGLSVDTFEVIDGEFGKKIIRVKLVGTQIEYTPGVLANGTTINLYTKLKLNRLTTNKDAKIEFKYTNEINSKLAYEVEGKDSVELPVDMVSKTGLLRVLKLENTLTKLSSESYDNEFSSLRLEHRTSNQIIKYSAAIANNFGKEISNVVIVGKMPTVEAESGNLEELISTFDATLNSGIVTSGGIVKIFYSENLNEPVDGNNWMENISDLSKIKSYKIELVNLQMKQGEILEFSYDIKVPDDLDNNQKAYITYTVYYELDGQKLYGHCTAKVVTDEKDISMEDIPEEDKEQVADLVVGTIVTKWQETLDETDVVFERQALEYTIVVTNSSNVSANNIKIQANAENANLYYLYKWIEPSYQGGGDYEVGKYIEDVNNEKIYEEFIIDTLNPGETKVFKYQVIVKDLKDIKVPEVFGKIKVQGDNFEEKNIETIKNKIIDGDISVLTEFGATENEQDSKVYAQAPLRFKVAYTNISDKIIENANVKIFISEELDLNEKAPIEGAEDFEKSIVESIDGTVINIIVPYMAPGVTNYFDLYAVAKDFDVNLLDRDTFIYTVIEYEGKLYYSNNYSRKLYQGKSKVEYSWYSDRSSDEVLKDGNIVRFTFMVTNSGKIDINELTALFNIDSGLKLRKVYVTSPGVTETIDGSKYKKAMLYDFPLNVGESMKLEYEFVVDDSLFEANQSVIESRIDVTSSRIDDFVTDVIQFKIKNDLVEGDKVDKIPDRDPSKDKDNPSVDEPNQGSSGNSHGSGNNNGSKKNYKITGKVWLDLNKDGVYNEDEKLMKGIGVYAYGAGDGEVYMSNIYSEAKTDKNGRYVLNNLPAGKYIIAFGFDSSIYAVTKYQSTKAKSNENSDVINKDLFGEKRDIGVTDVIEIIDRAEENIDMGLIQINDFDISLEKYIAKTTVKNSKGTKVYNYDKENLVKLEINSKVFENSVVDIEYKIVVENEGDLVGYINRIVDYVPEGLSFNKDLNKDWNVEEDGKLVYTGFMEKSINPGETKEISLILSIDIDNTKTKQIINNAELLDITNDRGFQDIDSIAGNAVEYEDDYGMVALLITVSTGRIINYTLIVISIISFICVLILGRMFFKEKIYK